MRSLFNRTSRAMMLASWLVLMTVGVVFSQVPQSWTDETIQVRYKGLLNELRCLVCQNQTLADSDAELAQDLREDVKSLLLTGKNDKEIKDYLTSRYGDFILYNPPVKRHTFLLWFGPFLLLLIGIMIVISILRKQQKTDVAGALNETEQRQLEETLKKEDTR